MMAVEVKNLSYVYSDGTKALDHLSLSVAKGQRVALLGANGSGKTTLLHHLNGLLLPQSGVVTIMGHPVCKENLPVIRKLVGMLFDHPDDQLFCTTVAEDVAFGPRNLGLDEETVERKVRQALEWVDMADSAEKPPFNLSLGQKKRVAVAGTLAMDSEIFVFDEPFSGLDAPAAAQMMGLLADLHRKGRTIILVTHDVDMAYGWADQVIIMSRGRVMAQGNCQLLEDEKLLAEANLASPMLVKVFAGTGFCPRTPEEAGLVLQLLQGKGFTALEGGKK